jgi:proline dehydrogenase
MALLDRAIVRLLPAVPKPVIRSVSSRYIAGSDLADATATVRELNARGKLATVDILGEEMTSVTETYEIARAYEELLAEIDRRHLDSNISIKPTALGLELDFATCKRNIRRLVHRARVRGNFVRIDMEDSTTTTATLALYRELREEGFDETGVVLQASLKRTLSDIDGLADLVPNVRICKGIYVESPDIQFRDFHAVQRSFVSALEALLDAGCYVGIATHDEWLLEQAKRIVAERSLGRDEYEFQMLLGVRPELGDRLVAEGHRLRIYVPFGSHWYEYSIRRLKENPSVAGYIASDTMVRVLHLNRNGGWVD